MSEWKPIETAPKDAEFILVRSRKGYIATVEWMLHGWALYESFVEGDGSGFGSPVYLRGSWEPAEWMPHPPPS